jgi:GNAT superfamily N-acetyltransferase
MKISAIKNNNARPKVNEDGKIVKGVNTTADVQPGETQRQAAKFGNKLNSKGEPPLLNAKARKNSSPHVLGNLGLAEAASPAGDLKQLQAKLTSQYSLKDLWLSDMATRDAFEISSIIVNKDDQKSGTGTAVMQELIAYADKNNKIVVLDPALKDKNHGTTSQSRLRKFYKRFGFIENKGRNKNYVFRSSMIRYPQTKKVTEEMQDKVYGYKAMNYNPETGEITSGADSRVTKGIKLRKGMTLKMPGKGIFMSTNRKYIEDYYSGHNDHEVLIKFKFDPATITSGNLTDRENEFTVPSATVVGFKVTDNLNESQQLNELFDKQYNWKWKIEPDPMDATSRADFRTHDGQLVAVGFDLQRGNASVDFAKNFSFGATNEGDQFRIFATVMDVIRDYAEKIDPKTLSFSAEKDPRSSRPNSRITLYKRMVAKFSQKIDMSFKFIDTDQDTIFKLTNNNMNEEIKKPRPEDTLGVSRADMPQIHASHYPELFNYLKQNGATISKGSVPATELKAVQGEFSDAGVEKMMRKGGITADGTKKPLIVSADNYIIDGHHRWLAAYNLEEEVPIIKFSLPVKELLQLVKDFKHTTYRGIYKENISVTGTERHEQEREQNLEPGTKAWFAHWFSLPKMTREDLNYFKEEVVKFVNDKKGVQDEKTINNRGHNRH